MNNTDIIKALRLCADKWQNEDYCVTGQPDCPFGETIIDCTERLHRTAADFIESLQTQLVESQRREQAAGEIINNLGKDLNTISGASEYIKPGTGVWHTIGIMLQAIENWRNCREGRTPNESNR